MEATDYDGSFHWGHPAHLIEAGAGLAVTETKAGLAVRTARGLWVDPWNTRGHYWSDRWYNVIRLEDPDGRLAGFYCNIATPAIFDGSTLRYIDLQLDVRVFVEPAGWRVEVLDEDEFEAARVRYAYPDEVVAKALAAIEEVERMSAAREFPFSD